MVLRPPALGDAGLVQIAANFLHLDGALWALHALLNNLNFSP